MRKFTILVLTVLFNVAAWAQTIVDTIPQSKNVVLEEFTGIHCTYCPDGHKISEQLATAHPNDFFAINIHVGSYATPSAGEPDFRTSFGTAISGQSGLTGYPAGTINRHLFSGMSQGSGTAMSRSNWGNASNTVLAQPSYVNLASTASIDLATRQLTVLVEGYFTGTGAPSSMKLNVAILQNNVEGPQTGMNSNPAQVLPNGKYNHMHMLRHMLTGQWGIAIDTTAQGSFFSRTFTYTIPADYTSVAVELANIEVVAFIAEGNQEIITGTMSAMNYVTPPGVFNADLKATDKTVLPELCGTSVVPRFLVTNTSSTVTVDTFSVQYKLNGGTAVVQNYFQALAPGDTMTVSFPSVNLTTSSNKIEFNVNVDNAYHLIDIASSNNNAATPQFYIMPAATIGSKYSEGFESYPAMTEDITNTIILNPTGASAFTITKAAVTGLTTELGGYAASTSSYMYNFYSIAAGESVEMMFHKIDFSGNTQYGLNFNYAYAQYASENDRLQVKVSDDCGATWATLWDKAGSVLKTADPVSSGNFFPTATQWKSATVDLSAYNGKSGVIVSFKGTSDYGNNLYIDDINIFNNTNVGIEMPEVQSSVSVFPNPAVDQAQLDINLTESANVTYTIINSVGQVVAQADLGLLQSGSHSEVINLNQYSTGLYIINISIDGNISTERLVIK